MRKNADVLEAKRQDFGVPKSAAFTSDEEFFAAGKLADAVVIATQDRDHYGHAMKALEVGVSHTSPKSPYRPCLKSATRSIRRQRKRTFMWSSAMC